MLPAGGLGMMLGFIYVASLTLVHPACSLFLTPVLGLSVGYLSGWFDAPPNLKSTLTRAGLAGGLTGLAVLVGQMVAGLITGVLVTQSSQWATLLRDWGLLDYVLADKNQYWQATLSLNLCCGLSNVILIAALALLGGFWWFKRQS